jgi:hypothetical protein
LGAWQDVLAVHDVKHAPLVLHTYGLHGVVLPGLQVPVPLQVDADVAIPLLHVPALQIDPAAYLRQAPLPSHLPSVPQVLCNWSTHLLLGSMSPAAVATHLPAWPLSLHEKQLAVQALSQQKPSAQKPDMHSTASAQI